jgi:transcriptional regulator with XRE-family HTH domain
VTETATDKEIGEFISRRRAELRFTQVALAKKARCDARTISRIEHGNAAKLDTLRFIAAALDVQLSEILEAVR